MAHWLAPRSPHKGTCSVNPQSLDAHGDLLPNETPAFFLEGLDEI